MAQSEETEWDQILRQRGILPPKEKEITITEDELDTIIDEAVARQREAEFNAASLDELEDMNADEDREAMARYRAKRIAEMKRASEGPRFGELRQISKPKYTQEVTEASKQHSVVLHMFRDSIPACKLLNGHLARLASMHPDIKFVKIMADQCVPDYPDRNLPTVLIYRDGEMKRQIVGIQAIPGGMGCTTGDVARLLQDAGVLSRSSSTNQDRRKDDEDDDEEEEENDSRRGPLDRHRLHRVTKGTHRSAAADEDSDSD